MKTINKFFLTLFVPLAVSCSKDDDHNDQAVVPVTMEFTTDLAIPELSEEQEIQINFDRPAPVAGTITIEFTPSNAAGFSTTPAVTDGEIQLQVAKGATKASFIIIPENDDLLQGNREIIFQLLDEDDNFRVGNKDTFELTIFEDEVAATANFSWLTHTIMENHSEEPVLPIEFSVPVPGVATLKVKVEGEAVADFLTTVPPMDANNIIELTVPSGAWNVNIGLQANNNTILQNHKDLKFSIIEVSGPVLKGQRLDLDLRIIDDEILGKLKSVEIINGNNKMVRTLQYDSNGRISKIVSEENASGYLRTENYEYNESGRLTGVISGIAGDADYLTWENGQIVKTEKMMGFFGVHQSFFEYDNGKLSRRRYFVLDGNRNATETDRYTYTYHSSGNLKTLIHTSLVNGAWQEVSTSTYDSYSEILNPFPLEAAPGLYLQQHLNVTLMIKQNNNTRAVYYAHTFNADGKLATRHDGYELIKYSYY